MYPFPILIPCLLPPGRCFVNRGLDIWLDNVFINIAYYRLNEWLVNLFLNLFYHWLNVRFVESLIYVRNIFCIGLFCLLYGRLQVGLVNLFVCPCDPV